MDTINVTVYTGLQHSLTHYDNMYPISVTNYMYVSCCVCRAIFSDRFVHVLRKQVAKNQQDVSMC